MAILATMASPHRPWLLIDVDGVLNPLLVSEAFEVYRLAPIDWAGPPLSVQLSPRLGTWITGLADLFDLAWATTWEESANTVIAPIVGLPTDLPVIPFREPRLRHRWGLSFKTPSVAAWVGDRPFVWLDDDTTDADTTWLRSVPGIGPFHLQHVDPRIGLTERDCREVRQWGEWLAGLQNAPRPGRSDQ